MSFPPVEIEIEFGGEPRTFRLGAKHVADLQEKCGYRVEWPDGSFGLKRKPLGAIWREMLRGDFDLGDCRQVLIQGRIGAGETPLSARTEVERVTADWPGEELWKHARLVLLATCQGFVPPGEPRAAAETQKPRSRKRTSTSTTQQPSAI